MKNKEKERIHAPASQRKSLHFFNVKKEAHFFFSSATLSLIEKIKKALQHWG